MNKYADNLDTHTVKQIMPAPEGLLVQEIEGGGPLHTRVICLALVEYREVPNSKGQQDGVAVPQVVAITTDTYSDWPPFYAELEHCVLEDEISCFNHGCGVHGGGI